MNQNQIVFVIDAGNTLIKVALFRQGNLDKIYFLKYSEINLLKEIIQSFNEYKVFIASVVSERETQKLQDVCPNATLFSNKLNFPVTIAYESPNTLGADRISNSVAAFSLSDNSDSVAIDIGTCIKFDFTDKNGIYHGGSISPGINLRYKSLNQFTGKLPFIEDNLHSKLIGNNTFNSMRSGVMNGIQFELNQFIHLYKAQYPEVKFFITGGDSIYFDFPYKNNIFVEQNLTIKGLYKIFLLNA